MAKHHNGLVFGVPFVLVTLTVIFVLAMIFTTEKSVAVEQAVTPTLEQPQTGEAAAPVQEEAPAGAGKPKVTYEE